MSKQTKSNISRVNFVRVIDNRSVICRAKRIWKIPGFVNHANTVCKQVVFDRWCCKRGYPWKNAFFQTHMLTRDQTDLVKIALESNPYATDEDVAKAAGLEWIRLYRDGDPFEECKPSDIVRGALYAHSYRPNSPEKGWANSDGVTFTYILEEGT